MGGQQASTSHTPALRYMLGLVLPLAGLLLSGCRGPEPSKLLVHISQVELKRFNAETLTVRLNYDLAEEAELPLPYLEVVVFPLEPEVKLAGALRPFKLYAGSVTASFPIPAEAGIDWDELRDPSVCCTVSLKGVGAEGEVERISNQVTVALPELSG